MASGSVSLAPTRFERVLGVLTLVLLGFVVTAVAKGSASWAKLPWELWLHLATMALVLGLTPVILWMRRGTFRHRVMGYIWVMSLTVTALISFRLRFNPDGGFSPIHLLSVFTLVMLVPLVLSAHRHQHAKHRSAVRGLCIGALLIAGFFTFPFNRLLGNWLFS
jgi:uncharacterized membrane protein